MNTMSELTAYLECGKNKLNAEFPKNQETTADLFHRVQAFLALDYDGISDNRVYRAFLDSFQEIICFAFEQDVSKRYLRGFFQIVNNEKVMGHLTKQAPSRATDIKNVMERFEDFFIATWQWCNNDKERVLEDIVTRIDWWRK